MSDRYSFGFIQTAQNRKLDRDPEDQGDIKAIYSIIIFIFAADLFRDRNV